MENYIGEIRLVGFSIVPRGWAVCGGALMSVSQNQALFSLLGTTYGGDGITTFGLPDLRSRVPVGYGNQYALGTLAGQENVTLLPAQMPEHVHSAITGTLNTATEADETNPVGRYPASSATPAFAALPSTGTLAADALQLTLQPSGGNQPHDNRQPYQTINYIIALQGNFPSRG